MWQQITVIIIVALAALYIVRRNWKKFKAGKGGQLDCAGGCESCKERAGCPFDQQTAIRPNCIGIEQNHKAGAVEGGSDYEHKT